ncbi:hypothetical protein ABW21_db0206653 [Orbilia brochopaga]|nr:hypothetical protein ABW21_db0206653 [Drechslerella brochopaga]
MQLHRVSHPTLLHVKGAHPIDPVVRQPSSSSNATRRVFSPGENLQPRYILSQRAGYTPPLFCNILRTDTPQASSRSLTENERGSAKESMAAPESSAVNPLPACSPACAPHEVCRKLAFCLCEGVDETPAFFSTLSPCNLKRI